MLFFPPPSPMNQAMLGWGTMCSRHRSHCSQIVFASWLQNKIMSDTFVENISWLADSFNNCERLHDMTLLELPIK